MWVLLLSIIMIVGTRMTWWGLLPLYLRDLGARDGQVGLTYTLMLVVQAPAHIVGGIVSDRWGRRYSITLPSLALAGILILGATAQSWLWLSITVWLVGLVSGIQQPGLQALVAESSLDQSRGTTFGSFYFVVALSQLVGPALGALLLPTIGISGLIWMTVGFASVGALARLAFLREGPYAVLATQIDLISWHDLLREPGIVRLVIINSLFLLIQGLTIQGPFVALHAADILELSQRNVNLLFAAGGVGAMLAAGLGGYIVDGLDGQRTSALATIGHAVLLVGWALIPGMSAAHYGIFASSWILAQVGRVGYVAWFSGYAPTAIRGRVLGMVGAIATLVSAAGPQIGTWVRAYAQSALTDSTLGWTRIASSAPFLLTLVLSILFAQSLLQMPDHAPR